jgi:hypothetical protein
MRLLLKVALGTMCSTAVTIVGTLCHPTREQTLVHCQYEWSSMFDAGIESFPDHNQLV